jgi:hypothetical protein
MATERETEPTTPLEQLKSLLQAMNAGDFEKLVAELAERLLDIRFTRARAGSQEGGDMGTVGREGRRLRIEAKRYTGDFNARDIIGGFHQALHRDPTLEAWIAASTRDIPEQLANPLEQEGWNEGVPVIAIDFPAADPPLAALCTLAPDIVARFAGAEAGELAEMLRDDLEPALARLRRELEQWQIGFEKLRRLAAEHILDLWQSKRTALAAFGQDLAGGDGRAFVRRLTSDEALDAWWNASGIEDSPALVLGQGGYGKTWASLSWLVGHLDDLPIVLTVPARSLPDGTRFSERSIIALLGDRLAELTRVKDVAHWSRRVERLLQRPDDEGPAIVQLIDGLNENPQVDWIALFQLQQDKPFSNRIRTIVTCRPQFFSGRLGSFRRLAQQGCQVPVEHFSTDPGGELDQMLAIHGITRAELHNDLIDLARVPRLFPLVVRLRTRLADAGRITVHRLLWEYGRDAFGERAGHSFSEAEWREWLAEIARRERAGQRPTTLAEISATAARPDLAPSEVSARLSDIIEGNFNLSGDEGQLAPGIVAHALGAALLDHLERIAGAQDRDIQAELDEWLDPISDLEERAELLRAACSIMAERDQRPPAEVAGALVAAWLQSRNLPDGHQREARSLGPDLIEGFLGAIEKSGAPGHTLARSIAIAALRAIPRNDEEAYSLILAASTRWMSKVSRDVNSRGEGFEQAEADRIKRFKERVGRDENGPMTVLGVSLNFEAHIDEKLQEAATSLLDGRPLAGAADIFVRAAIAVAIRHRYGVWEELKWLCLLNEVDPQETAAMLRELSAQIMRRRPEEGVNPKLTGRVAALLLWLTGMEADEGPAFERDSGIDRFWNYEDDYLRDPVRSLFRLERRHAAAALADRTIALRNRIQRAEDFILDPTFELPPEFIEDVRVVAAEFDLSRVDVGRYRTSEDVNFELIEPAVARCAPDLLAAMHQRKLLGYASRPVEMLDASAYAASEAAMLVDSEMAAACQSLRERSKDAPSYNSSSPSSLLLAEIIPLSAEEQLATVLEADLEWVLIDFEQVLKRPSAGTLDRLFKETRSNAQRLKILITLLAGADVTELSEETWKTIEAVAFDKSSDARGGAFIVLATVDPARFGTALLTADWDWLSDAHDLCQHYGSVALIAAGDQLEFEALAPRLHPTLLPRAIIERGSSRTEATLAAEILDGIVVRTDLETPDPGSAITINVDRRGDHPLLYSVTPGPMPGEEEYPFARLSRDVDQYQEHTRQALAIARERIRTAQEQGARLYLSNIDANDLLAIVTSSPGLIRAWTEGMEDVTRDFRRRITLAEGFFLALAETLLRLDSTDAGALWRALRGGLHTRYVGLGGVDELVLMLFRVPETPTVLELRTELLGLESSHTDEGLLDIAVAAIAHGLQDWLEAIIEADRQSEFAWRRRRGIALSGFTTGASLPVEGTHPEGPGTTSEEERIAVSARRRARDAIARHWWRLFVTSEDADAAFAAWTLFRRTADRRALAWLRDEPWPERNREDLSYRKVVQMDLNDRDVQKQAREREKDGSGKFLNLSTTDSVAPWYND